jgi:hypothetical protein
MIRTSTTAPQPVAGKMRYTIPAQIADWTRRFSGTQPVTEAPLPKPNRKVAAKKTVTKKSLPVSALKPMAEPKQEAKSLVFIKKEPVTFQIRRPEHPADFERMAFVVKACSTDPQRKALMVLHVEQIREGSWLVATDGSRLHAALIPAKIRSGDYKPVVTKEAISLGEPVTGIMFPAWRRVIPGDTVKKGVIDLADSGWGKDRNQTEKLSMAFNAFMRQTGELINLRYLEDLAKKKWALHCQRERNRAVMLKAEDVKLDMFAVIMPLATETEA